MRYIISLLGSCIVLCLTLVACYLPSASAQPSKAAVPTTIPLFLPMVSATNHQNALSTPSGNPTFTQTLIAPSTGVTAWLTYTNAHGVSLEYPAGWTLSRDNTDSVVSFQAPAPSASAQSFEQSVLVGFSTLPKSERYLISPFYRSPYHDGPDYRVFWPATMTNGGTPGLLYVFGMENFDGPFGSGQWGKDDTRLTASYYHEQLALIVSLTAPFRDGNTVMAHQGDLPAVVAQRYPIFDHMRQSVRFAAPASPTASLPFTIPVTTDPFHLSITPVFTQTNLADMGVITAWTTYRRPTGISFEYPAIWTVAEQRDEQGGIYLEFSKGDNPISRTALLGVHILENISNDLPIDPRNLYERPNVKSGQVNLYWRTDFAGKKGRGGKLFVGGCLDNTANGLHFADGVCRPSLHASVLGVLSASYQPGDSDLSMALIEFAINFHDESGLMAQRDGLVKVVEDRYPIFDHIIKSVYFPASPGLPEGQK